MKNLPAIALLVTILILTPETRAQNGDSAKPDKNAALVSVPVAVSDRQGRYIPGLKKEDFSVFQDGVRQNIVSFDTEEEPLNVALLLDTSRSTARSLDKIKDAAKDFIGLLNSQDKGLVATFDLKFNVLSQFTSSQTDLKNAVDKVKISDEVGSLMRHSVSRLVESSFPRVKGRKALIVLTDGKDFGSYITKTELLELLQESDVMVYTVFYKTGVNIEKMEASSRKYEAKASKKKKKGFGIVIPGGDEEEAPSVEEIKERERKADLDAVDSLKRMSDATFGRFYLREITDLRTVFEQIADELRKQYRIGFYSNRANANPMTHTIRVRVNRPDVIVRARENFRQQLTDQ